MPEFTVNGVINELKSANIIRETTGYSRNQIFVFSEYVEIFLSEWFIKRKNQKIRSIKKYKTKNQKNCFIFFEKFLQMTQWHYKHV